MVNTRKGAKNTNEPPPSSTSGLRDDSTAETTETPPGGIMGQPLVSEDTRSVLSTVRSRSRQTTSSSRRRRAAAQLVAAERLAEIEKKKLEIDQELIRKTLEIEMEDIDEEEEFEKDVGSENARSRTADWVFGSREQPPPVTDPPRRDARKEPTTEAVSETARQRGEAMDGGQSTGASETTLQRPLVRATERGSKMETDLVVARRPQGDAVHNVAGMSEIALLAREIRNIASQKDRCCSSKLPDFSGAIGEWLAFRSAYEEQARRFDAIENLARLRRSLRGEAKLAVSNQLLAGGDPQKVMKLLEKKFGRDQDVVLFQLKRMRALPNLTDVPRQLNDFSCTIEDVVATLRALKQEKYLHSVDAVQVVKSKMKPLMSKYIDFMYLRRDENTPELVIINEFLELESEKLSYGWTIEQREGPGPGAIAARSAPAPANAAAGRARHSVPARNEHRQAVHATVVVGGTTCPQCESTEHNLNACQKFKALSTEERWHSASSFRVCYRCLRQGHRSALCKTKKKCAVTDCGRRHHTLLHRSDVVELSTSSEREASAPPTEEFVACSSKGGDRAMVKIIPVTIYGPRGSVRTHALLDCGATGTLIKEEIADRVGAVGMPERLVLAETTIKATHKTRLVDLEISGPTRQRYPLWNAYTMPELALLTQSTSDYRHLPHLAGLPLKPYTDVVPSVIIGTNNYHLLVTLENRISGEGWELPSAARTRLGWVLCGPNGGRRDAARRDALSVHFSARLSPAEQELEALVKENYRLEALGVSRKERENPEVNQAVATLQSTCRRVDNGERWEAGLLWREGATTMPPNKGAALKRLKTMERKMDNDKAFGEAYATQMQHLIDSGYAQPAAPTESKKKWYLPHFAVINPNKPGKIRIVFDAAARVDGRSLNDALLTGPDLLQSLLGVLYRFREGQIAVCADIREMFLRIKVRDEDKAAQRFLWRKWDRKAPPTEYEMCSLLFGAASSPTTAIYVKNKNADEYNKERPEAVQAIHKQFYMDDYLQSFKSKEEAMRLAEQVKIINKNGGFELRGWASNDEEVVRQLDAERQSNDTRSLDLQAAEEKTLGLRWHPRSDLLSFNLSMARVSPDIASGERRPTKRQMLAVIMSVFDPLGLLTPIVTQGKVVMQHVWRSGISWDDKLADTEADEWNKWLQCLKCAWTCRVPRFYFIGQDTPTSIELHTFCDASEDAYAAVAYLRYELHNGRICTTLVGSKSRVTPLKHVSIPRLELQAALLGSRLSATIAAEHTLEIKKKTYWTDSSTVLSWLKGDPRTYKTFVSHRLSEIDELTESSSWRWVPSAENVADDATRAAIDFTEKHRWFIGPGFLRIPESEWPTQPDITIATTKEVESEEKKGTKQESVAAVNVTKQASPPTSHIPDASRFSKWTKLVRATAYVILFVEKCRRRHTGALERRHMDEAEKLLLMQVQEESFGTELTYLRSGRSPLPRDSRLQHLSPFIDATGVMRLRGRASAAPGVDRRTTEPIILCGRHVITRLLVYHHHVLAHHASPEAVVNHLRQLYWVVHLRPTVRAVERACQACRVRRAIPLDPPMGDLPAVRLNHHHRPFTYCGLDYFGPIDVTVGRRRREKRYGALFTCLVTRAVHVEVAWSLSTDSAISALRRMMARRGAPAVLYTDNGTNFHGADAELRRAWSEVDQAAVRDFVLNRGAEWRFIPPAAPFMGGAWERLVGSIRKALAVTLHQRAPADEVLATLLAEAEHCVNSRPLTHVSVDPGDPETLTPNHFLLGSSSGMPTPGSFDDTDLLRRRQWRAAQRLADIFWTRWLREYLPTLLPRPRVGDNRPELSTGDLVLVVDGTLPRNVWPRGVIERVLPGKDGHVRVADVRTVGGLLRRPARKLVRLPVERGVVEESSDRGENVDDGH